MRKASKQNPENGRFTCLPEVRERCVLFGPGVCGGSFDSDDQLCLEENRAVLREKARKEAAGYGVKDADHSGPI